MRAGPPRAERELAALATSRLNGCTYCASVHARFASVHSKRGSDVQRVLDEGVEVDVDPLDLRPTHDNHRHQLHAPTP